MTSTLTSLSGGGKNTAFPLKAVVDVLTPVVYRKRSSNRKKKDQKNAGKRGERGSEQLLPNIGRYGNNRLRGGIRGMCQGEEKGEKGRHHRRSLISQRGRKAKKHFTPWGSRKHR